jgi:hypothetical protein
MPKGFGARICVFIVSLELLLAGVVYFFRLENEVLSIPKVAEFLETQRHHANEDLFWYPSHVGQRVWGYADRHSIHRGETFNVMLAHRPHRPDFKGRIEIYRIGFYPDARDRERVWLSDYFVIEAPEQVSATTASLGAGWTSSSSIDTEDWRSGYYSIDVFGEDGQRDSDVAFMVVVDDTPKGDILVKLSTNTYQAYSRFGGHSLYTQTIGDDAGAMVSFDRPTASHFFDYEYYYVTWLEELAQKENLRVSYITDFDLHSNGDWPNGYKLFISLGHDEYWSKEEFDAIERRLFELGKNMLILSGNTGYWQVRYADLDRPPGAPDYGRQMICFKMADEPITRRTPAWKMLITAKFRDQSRRPETMLLGVGLDSWFSAVDPNLRYDYKVVDTSSPLFEGTGWKAGDSIGNNVVGYEFDSRDPERDGKRLYERGISHIKELPLDRIKVLFAAEPLDFQGKKSKAEAVYFETPAGAKVFNAGSIRWSWGVNKVEERSLSFQTFNRNLIHYMLANPPEQKPNANGSALNADAAKANVTKRRRR